MLVKSVKKFRRHPELVRLGEGWRKPKSRTNKIRQRLKGKKPRPMVGYGSKKEKRGVHPSGLFEVFVSNVKELNGIDKEKQCARISGSLGKRKKAEIVKEAEKAGIKILNPGTPKNLPLKQQPGDKK